MRSNFEFLSRYWPEIAEIGMTAEACFYNSPQMCITKLWALAQRIVGLMIDYENISVPVELNTEERINSVCHQNGRKRCRFPRKSAWRYGNISAYGAQPEQMVYGGLRKLELYG